MKRLLLAMGSVAAALALGAVFSGCGESENPGGDFDIAGTYTFQVNGGECKLEFRGNGKYYYTALTASNNKEGGYSVSGDEVSMSCTVAGTNITEAFAVTKDNGGNVTLKLKGNKPPSDILATFNMVNTTEVTLTKFTAPSINIKSEDIVGYYEDGEGVIEFKSDGTVEKTGRVTSLSFSGEWNLSGGNELTIFISEDKKETFIIKEFTSSGMELEKILSELFRDTYVRRLHDDMTIEGNYLAGYYTTDINNNQSTLYFDVDGQAYTFHNNEITYEGRWMPWHKYDRVVIWMSYSIRGNSYSYEVFNYVRNGPDYVLTLDDDSAEKSLVLEKLGVTAKQLVLTRLNYR
jgi:hypothetical protein